MTMKLRRGDLVRPALILVLAVVGVVAFAGSPAHAVNVSCGDAITADTTLHKDLINCPNNGILIGADNVTLDLNGHTVDGVGFEECPDCFGIDNLAGHSGLKVENGSVQEFAEGVLSIGGADLKVRRLALSRNGDGMALGSADGSEVTRNSLDENVFGIFVAETDKIRVAGNSVTEFASGGGCGVEIQDSQRVLIADNSVLASDPEAPITGSTCGIGLFGGSSNSRIARNSISGNGFVGLQVESSDDNVVSGNTISRSGEVGLILIGDRNAVTGNHVVDTVGGCEGCGSGISFEGGTGNLIANNTVERSQDTVGIQFAAYEPETPPAVDNVARANVVRGSGLDGILVQPTASDTLLERNLATNNGDDGIDVESPSTTLTRNTANQNQDLGIESVPGVIDGGGNIARHNGDPRQCTNIACN